jgi:hypothetical protein
MTYAHNPNFVSNDAAMVTVVQTLGAEIVSLRAQLQDVTLRANGCREDAQVANEKYEQSREANRRLAVELNGLQQTVVGQAHTIRWEDVANYLHDWGIWRIEHIPGERGGYVWHVRASNEVDVTAATLGEAVSKVQA